MQLSDWFTVVTIMVAVLAFYKPEERKLLLFKIGRKRIGITAVGLFLVLPFLLIYDSRIGFYFPCSCIFLAADWAFITLMGLAGYWVWWFFKRLPNQKVKQEVVEFYITATNTLPLEEVLRLFVKYEGPNKNSSSYVTLVLNKPFFQGALQHNSALIFKLLKDVEVDLLLENKLPKQIKDEILAQIASEKRKGTLSIYNQEPLTIDNERDKLILFPLLDSYFSMLNKCIIKNKFDTNRFGILNFFLPNIFKEILTSIQINTDINLNIEAPTYNHQLLNKTLSYFYDILCESENEKESYTLVVKFFAPIYADCIMSLFERSDVIKKDYLKNQYKSFFDTYFKDIYNFKDTIESINTNIVDELNKERDKKKKRELFNVCWENTDEAIFCKGLQISQAQKKKRERFIEDVVNKI